MPTETAIAIPIDQTHAEPFITVTEMARACIIRNLQAHFKGFLAAARLDELYLLDSILMDHDSSNLGPDCKEAEIPLAEAFMTALDSDDTYVKVPGECIEAVEEFLKQLNEAPVDDVPEPKGPKLLAFQPRQTVQDEPIHAS